MKRVWITGAGPNGFIGRNLKEHLEKKYQVFVTSSTELDLCDLEQVMRYIDKNRIDSVVHAATYTKRALNSEVELDANLKMFYNLQFCHNQLEKILYFGSGAEFDKRYDINLISENDFGRSIPVNAYGFGKYIMNHAARASENIYNLRLFGVYGKYENWRTTFISNLCCKAIFDLPLSIRQDCSFDFLYIDDLFPVVDWFLGNTPEYHDYNVCTSSPCDLTDIARIVLEVSGKELPIIILNEGRNLTYTGSNNRIRGQVQDFSPRSLRSGIESLYNWYFNNRELIDYEVLVQTK
ncbi:NAD-dependent epimerase/dehydratase family protein [Brevibacillus migulae]|uniref:NAD-dependent epimerase/dehydratase family protein n=1 Tax=Brevibacillus migulae TaxID=1644114 RepID=UPI00106F0951|nr:NAD(P)-dependent oxidoreductase [Brevibacillus migulae]